MTEVWFRDPHNYVRELVECGQGLVTWNRGLIRKRKIDPVGFMDLYYSQAIKWRTIVVSSRGAAELGKGRGMDRPLAVYPVWEYGDEWAFLEDMVENNVGENEEACQEELVPDERPVFGQEHRVVITNLPSTNTGPGRAFMRKLKLLQEDFPHVKIMVHGLYSFKYAFGMGFAAADMEPRTSAAKGRLQLASGGEMEYQRVQGKATWLSAVGMTPADVEIPRNRCIFNIKSALWAGENFNSYANFKTSPTKRINTTTPTRKYKAPKGLALSPLAKPQDGDMVVCNSCTLKLHCKQYREGEVCSLNKEEVGALARFFKTRDSDTIIDGLGTLLQMQATRLEATASEEADLEVYNPEVTKMINSLFSQGVTLAKLVDPRLRGGGVKVNVGVINGEATAAVSTSTASELTGQVVRALEQQGIPRDKITPALVMATLEGMQNPENASRAIEGQIIAQEDS